MVPPLPECFAYAAVADKAAHAFLAQLTIPGYAGCLWTKELCVGVLLWCPQVQGKWHTRSGSITPWGTHLSKCWFGGS